MKECVLNDDFSGAAAGSVPAGWALKYARRSLAPVFKIANLQRKKMLLAAGNGRPDCVGYLSRPVSVTGGRTYRLHCRFKVSAGINPHQNLLFCVYVGNCNSGIFEFNRTAG